MVGSIAHQTVSELGGRSSVLQRQRADHARLDRLVRQARERDGDEQQETLTAICRLVFPHAFAEESVLWPAVRRALPDGPGLPLRIEQEHQQVNELAALPLSVLDRTRDALDRLARRTRGRLAGAAVAASTGLAEVAGRVERFRPFTRGEHPSTHLDPT